MENIFNEVKKRFEAALSANRKIERQRLMISDDKIIALVELDQWCVDNPDTMMAKYFDRHYQSFIANAQKIGRIFSIPEDELAQETKAAVKSLRESLETEETRALKQFLKVSDCPEFSSIPPYHAAMRVKDVVDCWADTEMDSEFWGQSKLMSYLLGQSEDVVSFWRHVNALNDYSGLFPQNNGGKRVNVILQARQMGLAVEPGVG